MNILKDKFYLPIIFLLLVSFIWFSKIFYIWDHDTGLWYLISNQFNDNYTLYKNEFDNKGPLFFLFIKFVSYIIGYGVYQAYFFYSLCIFSFLLVLLYLINQKKLDYKIYWILLLSFTSIFLIKKPHIVFILFYYSFFLLFIHFLLKSVILNSKNYFILAFIFFSLCSIILIEIYLYSPLILLTFIYLFIFKEKKIDKIILYPILFLFVFGLINYLPKLYFGYSFKDFYTATILYQASSSKGPVMSINFIYFLILTLILPLFLKAIYFSNFKNFIIKRFDYFIIAIFLLISISKYLYFSDGTGGRYLLFLYIPLIYFIIYFSEYIKINKIIIALYFLISILVHGKNLAPPILKNLVFHNCFINFYCDAPSYANLFKGTVEYLNKNKNKKYYYVDINAWILIITNSDYYGVVNNNYIYSCKRGNCVDSIDKNEPWVTDGLLNAHNKFLNGEFGNMIIHDWLYIRNPEQLSKYWGEIVKHQVNLKKLDHFYLLEINKNNK